MKLTKNTKTIIFSLSLLMVIAIIILTTLSKPRNNNEATVTEAGNLVIKKSEVTKTASFYPYESNGTYMEVIAVRANDGTVRTALNTCQVCYSSGRGYYEQLGDRLICNNCGNQFTIDQIEVIKGGCNPVPIFDDMKTESDEIVEISTKSLVAFEPLFAKWKR